MIKVVCIKKCNNILSNAPNCMVGIIYDMEIFFDNCYQIYENGKFKGLFDKDNFITLAEWRQQQINSILNE